MTTGAPHPPAICVRCVHLEEAEGNHAKQYMRCGYPVILTSAMKHHAVNVHETDRLIPRHAIVGFTDSSRYIFCPGFSEKAKPKAILSPIAQQQRRHQAEQLAERQAKSADRAGLIDLLAPFAKAAP